jgi:methylmalonyl-CoA/ethylmalonyl-CoA epimerase
MDIHSVAYARAAQQDTSASFDIAPHHAAISVPNLEESIAWYHDMLDFEVVRQVTAGAGANITIALLQRGDCYLELFQVAGAAPLPEYRSSPTADLAVHGTKHFAFEVADARRAAEILAAKDAEIAMGPVENATEIFFFVRDNAGNTFEIIEYKTP